MRREGSKINIRKDEQISILQLQKNSLNSTVDILFQEGGMFLKDISKDARAIEIKHKSA